MGGPDGLEVEFTLLPADRLRPHESLNPELLAETEAAIDREGVVREPLLVEREHYVILDGHHRYEALVRLGCRRIPVYLVDYGDDAIRVETWPEAAVDRVTKEEVIQRALRGDPFPPKTSKHVVDGALDAAPVKLESLR